MIKKGSRIVVKSWNKTALNPTTEDYATVSHGLTDVEILDATFSSNYFPVSVEIGARMELCLCSVFKATLTFQVLNADNTIAIHVDFIEGLSNDKLSTLC